MDFLPIRRALLSVTDKTDLAPFAAFLVERGATLVSTGGTYRTLREAGLPVTQVSDVTGFPEIMDGRVKTLHPKIHGGILADKDNPAHLAQLAEHGIETFDLICVNLYNFAEAVQKNLDLRASVEEIDIGGPCMLRAAAKNFHSMLVVPHPQFYPEIKAALEAGDGKAPLELRRKMAAATFAATSAYDRMIADYLGRG
ncbi:MAG: IMP cyclohydrolase [Deltaproteobacteria bacterium]|nr:IMP cyclohydrolase [Deltaproteobacteria bacterium]